MEGRLHKSCRAAQRNRFCPICNENFEGKCARGASLLHIFALGEALVEHVQIVLDVWIFRILRLRLQ